MHWHMVGSRATLVTIQLTVAMFSRVEEQQNEQLRKHCGVWRCRLKYLEVIKSLPIRSDSTWIIQSLPF